jgi:hypothetical protein
MLLLAHKILTLQNRVNQVAKKRFKFKNPVSFFAWIRNK